MKRFTIIPWESDFAIIDVHGGLNHRVATGLTLADAARLLVMLEELTQ
jgi:hypothetical protein